MIRRLWKFNGGVHLPAHKEESASHPVRRAPLPKRLILPLHQHIGESAEAVVKAGDRVLKGQMIAHAKGFVSAPVHAPSSGVVVETGDLPVPHPSGLSAPCIVIETDGADQWTQLQTHGDYTRLDPSALRNIIREAGIVGLGGAGFPSFIKLNPGPGKAVNTLILNGVECEPYITCDDMLMRERAPDIIAGLRIIRHALRARECIVAIEDNKPGAYAAMCAAAAGTDIHVVQVPTIYPAGGEKQLIKVLTGMEVPGNGLPIHIGVVCHNVGTAAAVYRAVEYGEPLISRYMTITGGNIAQPRNLEVLIGTPVKDLLDECGWNPATLDRLLMGGPMMGFALPGDDVPVIKTTNCILAMTAADSQPQRPVMPCIRCGACADACPVNLLPQQLYWHAHAKDLDKVQEYNLFDCIECGCCSYVCPSNIPLVHYYRYAKTEIWAKEREKQKAEAARLRYEFRLQRIEREKTERAAKHTQKKEELTAAPVDPSGTKKAAIVAAMERAQAKREEVKSEE